MVKGKKINVPTLLEEIKVFDEKTKKLFLSLYEYIYYELQWSHNQIPNNRTKLYKKIEELFNSEL